MVAHIAGQGSGTTVPHRIMTLSGPEGTTQPMVTTASVTVDEVHVTSGNIHVVSGNTYGMMSGTNVFAPVMVESGVATDPQRLVTAGQVTVESVFVASGNVFLQSGDNLLGSFAITSSVTLPTDTFIISGLLGRASGTTVDKFLMTESGDNEIQRLVTAGTVSVDSVFVASGNLFLQSGDNLLGSFAISSSATLPVSGNAFGQYGQASGTTVFHPIMLESGATGTPKRVVVSASIDSAFIPSGNIYIQSGDNMLGSFAITSQVVWNGPGSIYGTGIGSVHADVLGSVVVSSALGSVAVTSQVPWNAPGSIYGTGIGSVHADVLGSVVVSSALGSVAVTSQEAWDNVGSAYVTRLPIGSIYGIGIGSVFAQTLGSQVISAQVPWNAPGSIYGIGIGSVFSQVLGSVVVSNMAGSVAITSQTIGSIFGIGVGSVHATTHYADLGSPSFKIATTNISGIFTQVFDPGAGSFLEVHGYGFTCRRNTIINVVGSAATPIIIRTHYIDVASGIEFEKTFAMPIRPIGSTVPIGFNTSVEGSVSFTIYGRPVTA